MGRRRKTEQYLTSDEIYSEWRKWKDTGVVSDEMARQMQKLARHMLTMPQFNDYAPHMKEEMEQDACLKIMKNLKNMKEEKRKSFFSYWSCCCWTAFIVYLRNHYKRINEQRRFLVEQLEYARCNSLGTFRPDVMRNLQDLIDLYDNTAPKNRSGEE